MHLRRVALLTGAIVCSGLLQPPAAAQEPCKDPRRIVGGVPADIKEHPWQVAFDIKGGLCGGSIIAQNWVLTAAHCFGDTKQPADVRVKAGATNRKLGVWSVVDRVVVHENYNSKTNEHDLALVKLKIRPAGPAIPLAQPEQELKACQVLEITGWGRTTQGGAASETLQKAEVPYVETVTCNEPNAYNGKIKANMICAGLRDGGVDSCQGDSGGPLVLRGPDGAVLIGVVSWGEGCAQKLKYGVYTRVTPYRDWITKVITSER
jgi:trypsin